MGITKQQQIGKKKKISDKVLDDLWALKVKERDGFACVVCGKTSGLNSHHIYSRSNYSTRWDINNGVTLCVSHHVFGNELSAHKTPTDFSDWLVHKYGRLFIDDLKRKKSLAYDGDRKSALLRLKSYSFGKLQEDHAVITM